MVNVILIAVFAEWLEQQNDKDADAVARYIQLLREKGTTLPHPYSSAIVGGGGLRELRVQSKGRPIRVFYMFDPERNAVVLLGAHKMGADRRFYESKVPEAKALWAEYLKTQSARNKSK